jgi:ABC-type branched-subunit amino acid transport system substrate-binding protein
MKVTRNLTAKMLIGLVCLMSFLYGASQSSTAQDPLAARERRGKQIYLQGTSPSGKTILAYLGSEAIEVPGDSLPCANCHGSDGKGKPEGGVDPSNITWEALTKSYGVIHASGRKHPAYTDRAIELAITRGIDPAGNKLLNVMPRYQMTSEDMADLVAYLKRLGKDRVPGVDENKIVIGTIVPANGALAEMGQAVKALLNAFFEELNSKGGIYDRRLELRSIETAETPAATRVKVEQSLKNEAVFVMTAAFVAGAEKEIPPVLAQTQVPLIGPFTLYPPTGLPLNRQVFYLFSGTNEQLRALVDFAAKRPELKNPGVAVIYPGGEIHSTTFEAIKDQSKTQAWDDPQSYEYAGGQFDSAAAVAKLKPANRTVVFFLGGSAEATSFLNEAAKAGWFPTVFFPSANASASIFEAPAGFDGKLFVSFPITPADQTPEGMSAFRALAEKYKLTTKHVAAQLSAYSAATVLTEALKRAGRDLSREKLIQVLEGFYEYRTGLTPPITYGPNRRIGALGAYVVMVDLKAKQFTPAGGWVGIN